MHFQLSRVGHLPKAGALALALVVALGASGCVVREEHPVVTEVVAPQPPPPPRVEVIPAPPRPPEFVEWEPGHWHWDGREYRWIEGHYIERPHREAVYVPGHWDERPNGTWVWVGPHWR
jgi:hypothetical protein